MRIDTSTIEGRKLAIIYELVKTIPQDFEPYNPKSDIYHDGAVFGFTPEDAYIEGKYQARWEIKNLIEAIEVEVK